MSLWKTKRRDSEDEEAKACLGGESSLPGCGRSSPGFPSRASGEASCDNIQNSRRTATAMPRRLFGVFGV
eukprot:830704-Prorocentrum_minimum.AAC.1